MEQKNESRPTGQPAGADTRSAAEMQEDNATGSRQNDQGHASFFTGTTMGGGSNFGQGSSHLGGDSFRQGSRTSTGSNYDNEAEGIGRCVTNPAGDEVSAPSLPQSGSKLEEDNRQNASLDAGEELYYSRTAQPGGRPPGRATPDSGRPRSGSWSQSSTEGE